MKREHAGLTQIASSNNVNLTETKQQWLGQMLLSLKGKGAEPMSLSLPMLSWTMDLRQRDGEGICGRH